MSRPNSLKKVYTVQLQRTCSHRSLEIQLIHLRISSRINFIYCELPVIYFESKSHKFSQIFEFALMPFPNPNSNSNKRRKSLPKPNILIRLCNIRVNVWGLCCWSLQSDANPFDPNANFRMVLIPHKFNSKRNTTQKLSSKPWTE